MMLDGWLTEDAMPMPLLMQEMIVREVVNIPAKHPDGTPVELKKQSATAPIDLRPIPGSLVIVIRPNNGK
jgi:hypothetical protein